MSEIASTTSPIFPQIEKVRILLTEWSALRAETISRMNHGYQLLSVGTAAITILIAAGVATEVPPWLKYILLAIFVPVYAFSAWFVLRDTWKLRDRMLEIEASINDRAGEDIILWETLWGGIGTGFWGRSKPKPRQFMATVVPPERTKRGHPITAQ